MPKWTRCWIRCCTARPSKVSAPRFHVFRKPGGITGFVILSESHLACHTYPEHGVITINLYCCRPRPEWPWRERLRELLGATHVEVQEVCRAGAPAWL